MRFAFMAACRSKNEAKARFKLPAGTTTGIVAICTRNGIDSAQHHATRTHCARRARMTCRPAWMLRRWRRFQASMKRRPDAELVRFAFMAACRLRNAAKARFYYPKLPAATSTGSSRVPDATASTSGHRPRHQPCDAKLLRQQGEDALQTERRRWRTRGVRGIDEVQARRLAAAVRADGRVPVEERAEGPLLLRQVPASTSTGIVQMIRVRMHRAPAATTSTRSRPRTAASSYPPLAARIRIRRHRRQGLDARDHDAQGRQAQGHVRARGQQVHGGR